MLFISDNGFCHKNGSKRMLKYSDETKKRHISERTYVLENERMNEGVYKYTKRKDDLETNPKVPNKRRPSERTYTVQNNVPTNARTNYGSKREVNDTGQKKVIATF